MIKQNKKSVGPSFTYGSIAHASVLALAALAADGAWATSGCVVSADATISTSTPGACTIYDASPGANLTITGTGSISGGVTTGKNTANPTAPIGIFTASGGSITVLGGGVINNATGPGIGLGRSGSYTTETLGPDGFTPSGCSTPGFFGCSSGPTTITGTASPTTTTALSGSISNAGTISGQTYGILSSITGTGVTLGINNTGLITQNAGSTTGAGIAVFSGSSITGGITNSGTISGNNAVGALSSMGIQIQSGGFVSGGITNNTGGVISSTNNAAIAVDGTLTGGITNNANISGQGNGIYAGGSISGNITNGGTITSTGGNSAILVNTSSTITGNVVNTGTINTNTGVETGYGLEISGRINGSISNSGTLSGLAINSTGSVSGTITNTGTITDRNNYGLKLSNTTTPITFNNNGGTITGLVQLGDRNTLNLNSGYFSGTVLGAGTSTLNIAGTLSSATGSIVSTSQIVGPIQLNTLTNTTLNINGGFVAQNSISAGQVNVNSGGTLYLGRGTGTSVATGTSSGALSVASGGVLSVFNPSFAFLSGGSFINSGTLAIGAGSALTISGGTYTQTGTGLLQVGVASMSSYGKILSTSTNVGSMPTGAKIDVVVTPGATLTAGGLLQGVIRYAFGASSSITGGLASSFVVTDDSTAYDFVAETCAVGDDACSAGSVGLRIRAANTAAPGTTPATRPLVTTGVSGTIFQMLRMGNNVVQAVSASNGTGGGMSGGDVLGDRHGWIKPLMMRSKQNDEGTVSGYTANSSGIIGGMDGTYNEKTRLGFAASYMTSKVESNRTLATHDADISSWRLIGYGSYALSANTEATFQGDYSTGTIKGRRQIAVGDVASSNYKNNTWHFSGAVSRVMDLTPGKTTFTPTVRVDYTHSHDSGYNETGGSTNLAVQSNTSKEMIVALQGKVNHAISSTTILSVNASAGYDVIGQQSSLTAAALGGGSTFVATGMAPQRQVYQLGVGSLTKLAEGGEVNLRYDLETRRGFTGQSISVKYRKPF